MSTENSMPHFVTDVTIFGEAAQRISAGEQTKDDVSLVLWQIKVAWDDHVEAKKSMGGAEPINDDDLVKFMQGFADVVYPQKGGEPC
tara:strand:- start:341 stop:601 length:261 start_codon:yes stop_codon:yes gene_type:complete